MCSNGSKMIKGNFEKIKQEVDVIWASSKAMMTLTSSQLQNYQIDCNRYQANCGKVQFNSFRDYFMATMKPYKIKM